MPFEDSFFPARVHYMPIGQLLFQEHLNAEKDHTAVDADIGIVNSRIRNMVIAPFPCEGGALRKKIVKAEAGLRSEVESIRLPAKIKIQR